MLYSLNVLIIFIKKKKLVTAEQFSVKTMKGFVIHRMKEQSLSI